MALPGVPLGHARIDHPSQGPLVMGTRRNISGAKLRLRVEHRRSRLVAVPVSGMGMGMLSARGNLVGKIGRTLARSWGSPP